MIRISAPCASCQGRQTMETAERPQLDMSGSPHRPCSRRLTDASRRLELDSDDHVLAVRFRDRQTTPTSKQLARPLGRDVILGACRQHRLANWTIWW